MARHLSDKKERIADAYDKLGTLGVNVQAIRKMNLSADQLEDIYHGIASLAEKHRTLFGKGCGG
ncbi:hypothetical protein NTE_02157 [Candidatus Nitrososphaera evergladensis SR1]|jgi:hypothetical protein|uniref:Uncharacterized protein n=1 Tax=Candidatus Nitrososphaera evergladensis SR1 TaxID=1459636 RepID=A0A075MRR9_9ARCH|nr:hypothetical protein [Candidatus Nitrososphaera evergladensis]AIF84211.1 hypothetical protein NTE_02157 [Candidatus Nitrososphaera evergladensis SR1]